MDSKFMDRLGILKVRYDLTYSKLAVLIGVTNDKAGNYLSGRTKMPMEKVLQLSAALRIDANWLLRGDGISPIKDLISIDPAKIDQPVREKFGALTNDAFGLIFEEIQSLKDQLARLEEQVNRNP